MACRIVGWSGDENRRAINWGEQRAVWRGRYGRDVCGRRFAESGEEDGVNRSV